ncbi:MAG: hypothetical protein SFY81_00890, partial [Verrucomicrobiota bacterium]|nr:hypothetical protein [Verrucomicrobiota bacterium]
MLIRLDHALIVRLRDHLRRMGLAYLVLLITFIPAGIAFYRARSNVHSKEAYRFNSIVSDSTALLERRFNETVQVLEGIRGLF